MENVCPINVLVKDTIQQSTTGKKSCDLQLSPSTSIHNIFRDVSVVFEYGVDEIEIVLQTGSGEDQNIVSNMCLLFISRFKLHMKLNAFTNIFLKPFQNFLVRKY